MSDRFPFPTPFGWFHVAFSHELKTGKSMPARFFGRELVIFRTESGVAKVLNAYCPHLGAHLGHGIGDQTGEGGEVRGEAIVCPFHGWSFNGEGECVDIPYAKRMPPKMAQGSVIQSYPVDEANGIVWMWYHPNGDAPHWKVKDIPETTSPEWSDMEIHRWTIRTQPQEMAENGSDPAHFSFVHGTAAPPEPNFMEYKGHEYSAEIVNVLDTPKGQVTSTFNIYNCGPGQAISSFIGLCDTVLQGCITPIDNETVQVSFAFHQRLAHQQSMGGLGKALIADICKQLNEDTPIWENKIYQAQPNLCDGDGPIAKFRKWYGQFYVA